MISFKQFLSSFLKVPKPLLIALVLSVLSYLLIELWLVDLPAAFPGADKLGNLASLICRSFITGYLFYVVVTQFKEQRNQANIKPFLISRLGKIAKEHATLSTMLHEASGGVPISVPANEAEIKRVFDAIMKNKKTGGEFTLGRQATWYESMFGRMRIIEKEFDRFLLVSSLQDPKLISLIEQIVSSDYYFWLEQYQYFYRKDSKMQILGEPLFARHFANYLNRMWEVQKYVLRNRLISESELAEIDKHLQDPKQARLYRKLMKDGLTTEDFDELQSHAK